MGLSFHNSIAVIDGYMGIKSSIVRTPRYNIVGLTRPTTDKRQKIPISNNLIIGGLLALLFCALRRIADRGVHFKESGLFIFHLMLAFGFGSVFIVSR
jgi:hypothetical protein